MRAHEPVNPFGLALLSRANQTAAFARMSRSRRRRWFSRRRCPVPPAQGLSARQRACRHPARLASPKWKSTGRSARTHAPRVFGRASRSHQIDHLSPELRRISGSVTGHQTPQKSISRVSTKSGQLQSGASLLEIVGIQSVSAADQGNFSPATAIASNDTGPTRHFPAVRI